MNAKAISFTVNGQNRDVQTDPARPLLDVLREDLHLTGTRFGCGEGDCGACSVLVDGKRVFSCITGVDEVSGKRVQTIEGLAKGDELHPVQQAFMDEGAFQCAYCTSGMIMSALALLSNRPEADREDIVRSMNGNICRCGTYPRIVAAVRIAAKRRPE